MLKVEHLTKVYEGGVLALEDVSFEVPEGQFLAVGPKKKGLFASLHKKKRQGKQSSS